MAKLPTAYPQREGEFLKLSKIIKNISLPRSMEESLPHDSEGMPVSGYYQLFRPHATHSH